MIRLRCKKTGEVRDALLPNIEDFQEIKEFLENNECTNVHLVDSDETDSYGDDIHIEYECITQYSKDKITHWNDAEALFGEYQIAIKNHMGFDRTYIHSISNQQIENYYDFVNEK